MPPGVRPYPRARKPKPIPPAAPPTPQAREQQLARRRGTPRVIQARAPTAPLPPEQRPIRRFAPPGELLFARLGSRRGRRGDRLRLARTRVGTNARGHAFCFPPSAFRLLEPPAHQPVIPRRHFARRVLTAPAPAPAVRVGVGRL